MQGRPFDAAQRERFLATLEDTGHIAMSADAAGVTTQCVYRIRAKDPEFAAAWEAALKIAVDRLEDEAVRRARFGVAEPVFYMGEVVGTVQRYSDALLTTLLKAKKPHEYRERTDVNLRGALGLGQLSDDELRQKLAELEGADLIG